jgi:hypothetical protein
MAQTHHQSAWDRAIVMMLLSLGHHNPISGFATVFTNRGLQILHSLYLKQSQPVTSRLLPILGPHIQLSFLGSYLQFVLGYFEEINA